MRILFVVEHFYPYVGGAEELFLNLTASLAERGFHVTVITTLHDKRLNKTENYRGVNIIRINCYNRFLFTFFSLPAIFKNIKSVDYIHTTSYNSAIPAFVAGLVTRKKVVITFHEVWGKLWFKLPFTPYWKLLSFYIYEWFILKLSFDNYIAVSDYTRQALVQSGIPPDKVIRIYNGLNYNVFKQKYLFNPPEIFTLCFYGRLGISKGLEILLAAMALLNSTHPEVKLRLIIPTYPNRLYHKIIRQIKSLKLDNNTEVLSNLSKDDLFKLVSNSSCVVIPSHSEGFCYVAAESSAMGVPVISSGKGSLKEVVSGSFIELDNLTVENLLLAFHKAIQNQWKNKSPHIFDLSDSINQYVDFYNGLIIKESQ